MPENATEQMERILATAARTESEVHAYRHLLEQEARAAATEADASVSSSPVHGWPFAVKEVFDVAGVSTSGGSPAFEDRMPKTDATVVQRLRAAGAVLVGTQISHELTCGLDQPPTRNPWNLACYPGGSSAGAGASVAVGSARFALGTDAAGSVRIPAAMTGTTGLKPTSGLVSSHGVMRQATAPSIDHVGIIARSAAEIADVLAVITGPDPWDAATLRSRPLVEGSSKNPVRLAVLGEATLAALAEFRSLDPDIETSFLAACTIFEDAGAEIVRLELPSLPKAIDAVVTFFSAELACANAEPLADRKSAYDAKVAAMIESGLAIPEEQMSEAVHIRSLVRQEITAAFAATGTLFLLTPTTPRPAMPLAQFDPSEEIATLVPLTCPFNLSGNPAISLPCGQTRDGLPIGLQIVGRHYSDVSLLGLAGQFQQQTDWHMKRPPDFG